jgi:hypothetical protein
LETIDGNYKNQVSQVGPFLPSNPVGQKTPIYGYAQPPEAKAKR